MGSAEGGHPDLFRFPHFLLICVPCFQYPDLFCFAPLSSDSFSEQIRENPLLPTPFLQVPNPPSQCPPLQDICGVLPQSPLHLWQPPRSFWDVIYSQFGEPPRASHLRSLSLRAVWLLTTLLTGQVQDHHPWHRQ